MDYQQIINDIYRDCLAEKDNGKLADYIPELTQVDPDKFGIQVTTLDGHGYGVGDYQEKFSIQSIAKLFSFTLALKLIGNALWKRVGVEPSGDPFNSLVQLEHEKGIPRNPLINAGALVICDVLVSELENPKAAFLDFMRTLSGEQDIRYNTTVAESEKANGYKNAAHINLMKSFDNIRNKVATVLDLYYHICAVEMSCEELSSAALLFANNGILPGNKERILSKSITKRINATTQLCGLYDQAGSFAFKVGLPGKSGVGGGIVAIHPGKYTISVWSPKLNEKGNSHKGIQALELFTTNTELSIF